MHEFLISYHRRDSFFHHLDPLSKVIWVLCIMLLSLTATSAIQQLVLAAIVIFCLRIGARIPFSETAMFVWFFFVSSAFFFLLQLLVTGGETVLFYVGTFPILLEALNHAGNVATRMLVFIGLALIFIDSTDPRDLGLALVQKLKINYTYAWMFFIALRFMPLFEKELVDLYQAYQLRNVGSRGGLRQKFSMLQLLTTSLIYRGMRRSIYLALSMESRAFRAYSERSYITTVEFSWQGKIFAVAVITLTLLTMLFLWNADSLKILPTGV